jgi:hypothetical protein
MLVNLHSYLVGHKKASGIFLKSSLDSAINSVIPALKEALSQK